ncbi:hypothetical protein ASF41_13260 [Methylobacterium sp. Leaf111]|uniref:hypothetical protein n=1 Tax=Methylobacterium sp. Leaf111 TaxID=1736257 RepID=UPI0006F9848E|nr:hypothetical protein [Methylobacterium sp. Leaf111]KQP51149.1 hypothetical protein ASF41_13260 [Methylobacterium sp. Leaf111]
MRACVISERAKRLADNEVEADARMAATLHLLAADMRREAGAWSLCIENYHALTKYYLAQGEAKLVVAYIRKLMFVSKHWATPQERMEACLLAASVYVTTHQVVPATDAVTEAAAIAAQSNDRNAFEEVASLFEKIGRICPARPRKGKARCECRDADACIECRVAEDGVPAEFQVRIATGDGSPTRHSPWWPQASSGLDLVMKPPGPAGECSDWVAIRVKDGRYTVTTFPNWHGRAMRAARTMLAVSEKDRAGTEGPSSTVLQVECALEAFMNSVTYFIRNSRNKDKIAHLNELFLAKSRNESKKDRSPIVKWNILCKVMLGANCITDARMKDFRNFVELRNAIVHFDERNKEQIVPAVNSDHKILGLFKNKVFQREPPRPWVDRLLTYEFAVWSVELGEELIASFRRAWHDQEKKRYDRENHSAFISDGEES